MKIDLFSATGKKTGQVVWPSKFSEKENESLLAQAIHVYRARRHVGLSKTQTRSEVSLTKKKWFRQKGTGRARHGAQSAHIFVGGGSAHGPKGVKRVLSLPAKMRAKALKVILTTKVGNKEIVMMDKIATWKKTSDVQKFLDKASGGKRVTLVLSEKNKDVKRLVKNIENVTTVPFRNLNAYNVYFGGRMIIDREALVK